MRQTKLESLFEKLCSTGSGFLIALATWEYVIRPLVNDGVLSVEHSFTITLIFTVISIIRGYFWRRFFNANLHKFFAKNRGFDNE
jgi:hypothetical protein